MKGRAAVTVAVCIKVISFVRTIALFNFRINFLFRVICGHFILHLFLTDNLDVKNCTLPFHLEPNPTPKALTLAHLCQNGAFLGIR